MQSFDSFVLDTYISNDYITWNIIFKFTRNIFIKRQETKRGSRSQKKENEQDSSMKEWKTEEVRKVLVHGKKFILIKGLIFIRISRNSIVRKFRASINILKFWGLNAAARHLHGRHFTKEPSPLSTWVQQALSTKSLLLFLVAVASPSLKSS